MLVGQTTLCTYLKGTINVLVSVRALLWARPCLKHTVYFCIQPFALGTIITLPQLSYVSMKMEIVFKGLSCFSLLLGVSFRRTNILLLVILSNVPYLPWYNSFSSRFLNQPIHIKLLDGKEVKRKNQFINICIHDIKARQLWMFQIYCVRKVLHICSPKSWLLFDKCREELGYSLFNGL